MLLLNLQSDKSESRNGHSLNGPFGLKNDSYAIFSIGGYQSTCDRSEENQWEGKSYDPVSVSAVAL